MSQFVEVPPNRLQADILQALLEEFATRDGTDYGERELSLEQKVGDLRAKLHRGELMLLHNRMRELTEGDTLLVLATDPSTTRDIPRFCGFLGHELLGQDESDGNYRYLLRKGSGA